MAPRNSIKGKVKQSGLVKVKFFATLRLELGIAERDIFVEKESTVKDILEKCGDEVKQKLLENNDIIKGTIILVNGENIIHKDGLNTIVKSGDVISLFPPAGGG